MMPHLSEKLGCAKFSHQIKTERRNTSAILYTSKVLSQASLRVSTLLQGLPQIRKCC